jgi:hypothetical protein
MMHPAFRLLLPILTGICLEEGEGKLQQRQISKEEMDKIMPCLEQNREEFAELDAQQYNTYNYR